MLFIRSGSTTMAHPVVADDEPSASLFFYVGCDQCRISPILPPQKNAYRGPLVVIYKKQLPVCYAAFRGRMAFKTNYPNCKYNFGRTRPVDSSKVWGKITFSEGKDFRFYHMFQTNFSEHNKSLGTQKIIGGNCPRMPPVSARLGRTVAKKSSIGGLHVCTGG